MLTECTLLLHSSLSIICLLRSFSFCSLLYFLSLPWLYCPFALTLVLHSLCPDASVSLLSLPFSILVFWMVKSHWHECNVSLFFLLGMTGPGDRAGPSVITETYCKGQGAEGERKGKRQRQTACRGQHLSGTQKEREQNQAKEWDDLLWMGSRPLWDMDNVCIWGRGSLMTTRIAAVYCPWALLAESCQLLSLPWAPLGPDEEPKYLQQIILSWHWNEDIIIQHTWECTKSGLCMPNQNVNNYPKLCRLQTKAVLESDACTAVTIQLLTVTKWTDCHCRGSCWFRSHFFFVFNGSQ